MAHAEEAATFVADKERTRWHDESLWFVRAKRDRVADDVPDWEALREEAARIKRDALTRLPELWDQFEENARAAGAIVHWARDAAEHNQIVTKLLQERGIRRVVKSKSMLTEECDLNPHLERNGIEIIDTDLGERIVQLRHEAPSHIVMPAIHLRREEVGALFEREMGSPPGLDDPDALTAIARRELRERFVNAEAGLTGMNFAIAETGGFVVVSNEGNVDLGTALPDLHIASVGLEKVIPQQQDLAVFLRLLARSATGQHITTYTSHFRGPRRPSAAPSLSSPAPPTSHEHSAKASQEMHIVVVDNGRSRLLGQPAYRAALACIRCGACLNTCPVYRRSGGHSYGTTIPGPIGSVLEPNRNPAAHGDLPHACSLCGSCSNICPVKIPLHHQLLTLRGDLNQRQSAGAEVAKGGPSGKGSRWAFAAAEFAFRHPRFYDVASRVSRSFAKYIPEAWLTRLAGPWSRERALPEIPSQSFRELYRNRSAHNAQSPQGEPKS